MTSKCLVCNQSPADKAHIKTRGSGGSDEDWNIMPLCREHHVEQHKIGIITFANKYLSVRKYLESKEWVIIELFGKKKLTRGVE